MKKMVITILAVLAIAGVIAMRYVWIRSWRTRLTSDGHPVAAPTYRNWSGDILVDLRSVSGSLYVVRRSEMKVGIPNASSVIESPAIVFAKEYPLRSVDLRTEKAGGIDPNLLLTSEKLSFIAVDGKTIQVSWSEQR
jgi:hypothetical protein